MESLRQTFAAELEEARESLRRENEGHLSSFRRELAGEQVEEERKLRREMDNTLNSLRAKVRHTNKHTYKQTYIHTTQIRDEEEEEEARLYEAKADVLRKLKQQVILSTRATGNTVNSSSR